VESTEFIERGGGFVLYAGALSIYILRDAWKRVRREQTEF
jgi:hypothetical protein